MAELWLQRSWTVCAARCCAFENDDGKRFGDWILENQSPAQLRPTTCLPLSFLLGDLMHGLEHAVAEVGIGNRELDVEHKEARKHKRRVPFAKLIGVGCDVIVLQRSESDNGKCRWREYDLDDLALFFWNTVPSKVHKYE